MEKLKYKVREHVFMLVGSTIKDGYVIGRTETITEVPCYKVAFIDEEYMIREQVFFEEDLHSSINLLLGSLKDEYEVSLGEYTGKDPFNYLVKECADKYGV
jgi:hypothetical protein